MMMVGKTVHVHVCWLPAENGGRRQPFAGDVYATTARFSGETELFSVVLRFPLKSQPNPSEGELSLLVPENLPDIQERLQPGKELEITEGNRTVANCQILSLQR